MKRDESEQSFVLGERESLIVRDQEERQQAMYKYQRVEKFRRQQSPLWNALYPTIVNDRNSSSSSLFHLII